MAKYLALVSLALLVGSGPLTVDQSSLTPGLAANVQAGPGASQTVGQSRNVTVTRPQARVDASESRVRADTVQTQTINEAPWWLIAWAVGASMLLVAGWADNVGRWLGNYGRRHKEP